MNYFSKKKKIHFIKNKLDTYKLFKKMYHEWSKNLGGKIMGYLKKIQK